jgi:CheY-like chemotaxis protein
MSEKPPDEDANELEVEGAQAHGAVLVVEDEPVVRQFAVDSLREAGFETLEAEGAEEALRILEERTDLKVLVTDVRMPGPVNGYFLARKVRERGPYVDIILASGYAAPERRDIRFDCDLLVKPFESEELVRRVAQRARRAGSR